MEKANSIILLLKLVVVLALLTLFQPSMRNAWIRVMNGFANNFRGGPPTGMHPIPADDTLLLRKRRGDRR
jgi:hypothetical protein